MRELRNGAARLLVVDDNKVNRLLLTRSLELQGHSTASAENGRIALEMLRREPFDLVLLDMEMPEMDGFQVLEQLVNDRKLRDQQKELVRRFATPEVAQDLQDSGFSLGGKLVHASVMFSDIRGFTALAESQPPEETIELLNTYYALMFDAISGHGGVVTVMMGDGLMSVFGAPVPLPGHGESAVRAAQEMVELIDLFNRERQTAEKPTIKIG